MSEPIVADDKPRAVPLEPGETYHWRACGHDHLNQFDGDDSATWKKEIADLTGISYAGYDPAR